jgi:hypothetical protein
MKFSLCKKDQHITNVMTSFERDSIVRCFLSENFPWLKTLVNSQRRIRKFSRYSSFSFTADGVYYRRNFSGVIIDTPTLSHVLTSHVHFMQVVKLKSILHCQNRFALRVLTPWSQCFQNVKSTLWAKVHKYWIRRSFFYRENPEGKDIMRVSL